MVLNTVFPTAFPLQLAHYSVRLISRTKLFVFFFLLIKVITFESFGQTQINYSPTITGFTFSNEKVFTADANGDAYLDMVTYNAGNGVVSALLHNGNSSVNSIEFTNTYSVTVSPSILIDVKCIDALDTKGDLISYNTGGVNIVFYYYASTGSAFSPGVALSSNLPNGNYQFGTFDINNDGKYEIYALDKANATLYYGTVDVPNGQVNFSTLTSLPFITANSIVHIVNGHFESALNDLCYVVETPNGNLSNYNFQVLKNNNGSSLSLSFFFNNPNLSTQNQLFYAGKFTSDNYSDIAIYPADGKIYVLDNVTGTTFGSMAVWQANLAILPNALLTLDAGNYSANTIYDDILLVETSAFTVPANLGKTYVDKNSGNNTFIAPLTELQIAPCYLNPVSSNSIDYHLLQGDFNQDGISDVVIYNSTLPMPLLKVGIISTIQPSFVEGYCWPQSAAPTEPINFFISGTALQGKIDIFRYESRNENVEEIYVTTLLLPNGIPDQANITNSDVVTNGCGWSSTYTLTIPNGWISGYYAARVTNENCISTSINFIVKNNGLSSKRLALIANTNTWAAYNKYTKGGRNGSKYDDVYVQSKYHNFSFMRPITNNGIKDNSRPHLARAELWIFTWLKDNGYDPDVITDLDVDLNVNTFLNNYDYLVMGTHPEYWTGKMYDNVKDFQENGGAGKGGNLICLGGNAVFEVVEIDLSQTNPLNPILKVYPNSPLGVATQNNQQYPLQNMPQLGGQQNASPAIVGNDILYDRFDFFWESYNFGASNNPVINKRTIDLIGVHYQNINSYGINNTSYTLNNVNSPFFTGIAANAVIGDHGYCTQDGVQPNGSGKASGWECDRYTPTEVPFNHAVYPPTFTNNNLSPNTAASPTNTSSVYDADIQILATATPTQWSNPQVYFYNQNNAVYCPNGMNNSEIIYVPPQCISPKRGFVFTAGSICVGGSLVWNYVGGANPYNNDLSKLLKNVLDQFHFNVKIVKTNINCQGAGGSVLAIGSSCGTINYTLLPNNITNTSGYFPIATAGIYTITAVDVDMNSVSKTFEIFVPSANNFCCSQFAESLVSTANMNLEVAPTASHLLQLYSNGTNVISNKTFYIDDVFAVDANITFKNCTLWFTPTASIQLQGPYTLDVNASTLQASCNHWVGIVADNVAQKVIIQNNSTIKQAIWGVYISDNALAEISNSHFEENGVASIVFSDISDPNYMGKIINNTFTSTNTLPIPSTPHPYCGIIARNVSHLNIGELNNANSINHFDGMFTGIYINSTQPVNYAGIGIYNASFENIHAPNTAVWPVTTQESIIVDNTYTNPKGAGIYSNFGALPTTYAIVDIRNDNLPANPNFYNCDKAIVSIGNALMVKKQYTENCLLGIMCSSPYSRNYTIEENTLFNSHLGIELFGRHKSSFINKNTITSNFGIMAQGAPVMFRAPVGIKVQYGQQTQQTQPNHFITNNIVDIRNITGIGINTMYGDGTILTEVNDITFSTNSVNPAWGYKNTSLYGIYSDGCIGSTYSENTVRGNSLAFSNFQYWQNRDTKGFYFGQGPECTISCNKARFTTQGFYVWGNNATTSDPKKVRYNKFYGNDIPWFFSDYNSPTTATFGNVGDASTDNRNEFLFQPFNLLNPNGYKVFRASTFPSPYIIFTDFNILNPSESGSAPFGNAYLWQDPNQGPTYQDPCSFDAVFSNFTIPITPGLDSTIFNNALAIAQDSMQYINFPVVGGWIDKLRLYERLKADSVLRYSNPDLLQFYVNYSGQAISDIAHTDVAMKILSDSNLNLSEFNARYAEALNRNMNISSSDMWEQHVQNINLIELKWIRYGTDSLTNTDTNYIHTLAVSCPFIEGTAVYTARILWSYFEPDAFFDDRYLCNAGSNKQENSGTNYYNVDSIIYSQIQHQLNDNTHITKLENGETKMITVNDNEAISICPNPASTYITIAYKSPTDGYFKLYNALGEVVMQTQLSALNTKVQLMLSDVANALYHYDILFLDGQQSKGKLLIQKK